MRQTWRWFGPKDKVTVEDARQAGVEGIVTALHHVPTGDVWRPEEIEKRQREVAFLPDGSMSGLKWEVVESLPVSEPIKTQFGYHLIQVTDITDSQVVTLDEVEDHITEIVLQQEQKKMWDAWLVKTKEELGVQYKPGFELVTTTTVTTLVTDPETTSTTKE